MARDNWMAQVRQACESINREYPSPTLMEALENFEMVAEEYSAAQSRLIQQCVLSSLSIFMRRQKASNTHDA